MEEPESIGPYRILRVLGEGGMGMVYLAEQREPVRRRVALKVIKLGMDSKAVLARFALERQALAVMNHDAIAKVHDAGTTDRGQPYFVMELVEGVPITRYCDEHRLALTERIGLFAQVCAGVQHAHQKGVIHRDLKPGNVLVSRRGDAHVAKIIDFGVARATDQQLVAQTILTEQGVMVGTPEYMSPEQAGSEDLVLDTRTDIYSLGVMLYELLCGELPFSSRELRRAGPLEIQRKIREDEPPKPSTRIATVETTVAHDHAHRRRTTARTLTRALRGDLDWIVLKAIAKEPERRYASANGLALDLQRHLVHEPVLAGPPSAGYRIRKLLRRYRVQVAAAGAVLAVLALGAVTSTLLAVVASERAATIEQQSVELQRRTSEFDMLANVVHLRTARANEKQLDPAWPEKIPAIERRLAEDWARLEQALPDLRRTVDDLRARALTLTSEEHTELAAAVEAEVAPLRARLSAMRRAQAVRAGRERAEPAALDAALHRQTAVDLNTLAWPLIAPAPDERRVWGEESKGLALANLALEKVDAGDSSIDRPMVLDTLAWALLACGLDAAALQRSDGFRRRP
jgi:hypothetical protein